MQTERTKLSHKTFVEYMQFQLDHKKTKHRPADIMVMTSLLMRKSTIRFPGQTNWIQRLVANAAFFLPSALPRRQATKMGPATRYLGAIPRVQRRLGHDRF